MENGRVDGDCVQGETDIQPRPGDSIAGLWIDFLGMTAAWGCGVIFIGMYAGTGYPKPIDCSLLPLYQY